MERDNIRKRYYLILLIFIIIAGVASTTTVDQDSQAAAPLLDRIAIGEGTTDASAQEHGLVSAYDITYAYGNYNPSDSEPITEMKISEVKQLQQQMLANGAGSSAVGKYQLLGTTLEGQQNTLGLSDETVFDAATQDLFGLSLLERRGYNEWLDGTMSDHDFQKNLAKEWASIADPDTEESYYGQNVGTTDAQIKEAMAQTKSLASARILHDSLTQLRRNREVISSSEVINDRNVAFSAKLSNPNGKKVKLQVELRRLDEYGGQFDDTQGGLKESDLLESGSEATAYAYGLIDGDYHWRARAVNEDGTAGKWINYNRIDISCVDFTVSATQIDQPTAVPALQVTPHGSPLVTTPTVLADDFSRDTGLWSYSGNAYRDAQNGYVVLTPNKDLQVGNIWLNQDITSPFTIEFRYKAGGGTGADGLTLMFYKGKNYEPGKGGWLGFSPETGEVAPGYGIEFDNYENSEFSDPTERHIALIEDSVVNHLRSAGDPRTEDNQWHQVNVEVNARSIVVYVDGDQVINFEGDIDKNYGGLGFSAATWSYNNWHLIDDVKIGA